ncbi:FHA domain-containing protein [Cryobacterium sp. LW097]|uniref:FHA domain-containing protein FhaB/FipA n=1 Tax=unclassified Cryobacterium TaxID=2649013 RepID=UPI000B4CCE8C|nr:MULTISPECIES: FHA domain-containing protein [unclassified Cryobacterium]ASD20713.1 FHA domain-containing protein [Cryobacterium sp. LW097]TFC50598.1 FHA domain-containing protein [Cryobacterium sp. TMB3-1-2]TFC58467.1 FHA domain-containing protein [Cryobacterium sp. TMB1-7]TFC74212.1 FHA domain-containing protein [Cryobacterium sp. TMB3-10]TFC74816.1 FHA domain-containing protein [Cryobacterium sp. TMB3-15]
MNPSELTLLVLRLAFLLVLWLFIFGIVYALRSDLFGQRVRKMSTDAPAAAPVPFATPPPAPVPAGAFAQPPAASASAPTEQFSRQQAAPLPQAGPEKATAQTATRLVITSGPKAGTEFPLGTEPVTIGRSSDSSLVIRDDYTSTHHARLMLWHDDWMVQDLDSTNGTFLDGKRVAVPTSVPLNATVKIGATSFELRR